MQSGFLSNSSARTKQTPRLLRFSDEDILNSIQYFDYPHCPHPRQYILPLSCILCLHSCPVIEEPILVFLWLLNNLIFLKVSTNWDNMSVDPVYSLLWSVLCWLFEYARQEAASCHPPLWQSFHLQQNIIKKRVGYMWTFKDIVSLYQTEQYFQLLILDEQYLCREPSL